MRFQVNEIFSLAIFFLLHLRGFDLHLPHSTTFPANERYAAISMEAIRNGRNGSQEKCLCCFMCFAVEPSSVIVVVTIQIHLIL